MGTGRVSSRGQMEARTMDRGNMVSNTAGASLPHEVPAQWSRNGLRAHGCRGRYLTCPQRSRSTWILNCAPCESLQCVASSIGLNGLRSAALFFFFRRAVWSETLFEAV